MGDIHTTQAMPAAPQAPGREPGPHKLTLSHGQAPEMQSTEVIHRAQPMVYCLPHGPWNPNAPLPLCTVLMNLV